MNYQIINGVAVIPEGVTEIGYKAFEGYTELTSIEIPNSVTRIRDMAFRGCTGLTSIEIPDSVTEIGSGAFGGCTGLTNIEIPNSVTRIGSWAFENCTGLTSIEIPNSVTEIGDGAFVGCDGLNSIVVDSNNKMYKSLNNSILTKDGKKLTQGSKSSIIPDSVTEIGDYAFSGCKGLISIEIPNSVTRIGHSAFACCEGLTSIEIPNSVTEIGTCAFGGCIGLTSIEIPDSVTTIGWSVFKPCPCLNDVYIHYKNPESAMSIIDQLEDKDKITLHVPIGTGYAYRHSDFGKQFKAIVADSYNWKRKHSDSTQEKADDTHREDIETEASEIVKTEDTIDVKVQSTFDSDNSADKVVSTVSVNSRDSGFSVNTPSVHYLFFDTETTGLPRNYRAPSTDTSNWPRMVQLSWVTQDENGKTIKKGNYIIKPEGFTIPTQSSDIHGITTSRALREGISLRQALNEFLEDARQAQVLVGHNVGFDIKVLGCECVRVFGCDSICDKRFIDTMEAATDYCAIPGYYGYKWPKLQELHQKLFGYEFEDAHDSSADIAATVKCYWEMKRRGII